MTLRNKTLSGLKWSFADNTMSQVISFIVGIILARLLSPTEYGIIGMITVFIAVSDSLVDSGLSSALVMKQNCTEVDYNTMFYTNLGFGSVMFIVLFLSAGAISRFYHNAELILLTRVMAVNLIINSFGLVESAILIKKVDFKTQTKVSFISNIISGIIGITLAYLGFGYWSLASRTIAQNIVRVSLLYLFSTWRPKIAYSVESFKEMFGFGSKLMAAGLLNTIYLNIYKVIIGRYFTAAELGYYTRAEQFKNLPSQNFTNTIQKVTYPVLASISNDSAMLKAGYKKLIKLSFFVTSLMMLIMLVNAREIVLILVGNKWIPAIPYLQILCLSGVLYPLHALNLNILKAKNRSDLFLKLEVVKKILVIPVIMLGIRFGMLAMLWGMVINSVIAYLLNSIWSARLVNYATTEQLRDILPTFLNTGVMVALAFLAGLIVPDNNILSLLFKITVSVSYIIITGKLFKMPEYIELKGILVSQIHQQKHRFQLKRSNT